MQTIDDLRYRPPNIKNSDVLNYFSARAIHKTPGIVTAESSDELIHQYVRHMISILGIPQGEELEFPLFQLYKDSLRAKPEMKLSVIQNEIALGNAERTKQLALAKYLFVQGVFYGAGILEGNRKARSVLNDRSLFDTGHRACCVATDVIAGFHGGALNQLTYPIVRRYDDAVRVIYFSQEQNPPLRSVAMNTYESLGSSFLILQ